MSIQILDSLQAELVSANPIVTSGFGKYLKGTPAQILAGVDFAGQFRQSLATAMPGDSGFRLSFSKGFPLGDGGPTLTVSAGSQALIGVHNRSGQSLFDTPFLGVSPKVPGGAAYVSFLFRPSLGVGISDRLGRLSFGFNAGTDTEFRCDQRFDVLDTPPTLGQAVKSVLENFTIPGDLADLQAMAENSIASVSGNGQFKISASVDVFTAVNPLASIDTIPRLGKLNIAATGSVRVGFKATLSGEYQIRVHKTGPDKVSLSYHKMAARELGISLDANAGPGLSLGSRDLVKMFLSEGIKAPQPEVETLVTAGLSNAQIDTLSTAISIGLHRTLNISLNAQFSSLNQDDAAFLYEIDLTALDAEGTSAVEAALRGDLSGLNALEDDTANHGVRVVQSRLRNLRRRRVSWRVNLLGIVNAFSLSELVRKATVFQDFESGELVISDEVSTKRIGGLSDREGIRRVLYESALLTATYKAGGVDENTQLKAGQSFFAMERNANRPRMADFLDAAAGLNLIDRSAISARLGEHREYGPTTFLLECDYDQAACLAMFLNANDEPRTMEEFERLGRDALLALVQPGEADDYRRRPVQDDGLWKALRDAGRPSFGTVLPAPLNTDIRVAVIGADYTVIVWWAQAMSTAAEKLSDMRKFLKTATHTDLDQNPEFRKRRESLQRAMTSAIAKNQSSFGDPWGLLALFAASRGKGTVRGSLVSTQLTAFLPE